MTFVNRIAIVSESPGVGFDEVARVARGIAEASLA